MFGSRFYSSGSETRDGWEDANRFSRRPAAKILVLAILPPLLLVCACVAVSLAVVRLPNTRPSSAALPQPSKPHTTSSAPSSLSSPSHPAHSLDHTLLAPVKRWIALHRKLAIMMLAAFVAVVVACAVLATLWSRLFVHLPDVETKPVKTLPAVNTAPFDWETAGIPCIVIAACFGIGGMVFAANRCRTGASNTMGGMCQSDDISFPALPSNPPDVPGWRVFVGFDAGGTREDCLETLTHNLLLLNRVAATKGNDPSPRTSLIRLPGSHLLQDPPVYGRMAADLYATVNRKFEFGPNDAVFFVSSNNELLVGDLTTANGTYQEERTVCAVKASKVGDAIASNRLLERFARSLDALMCEVSRLPSLRKPYNHRQSAIRK